MVRQSGFTVVEIMVTLAVVAILLVAGVPAMRGVVENGRIRTAGEAWKYGLALARAEAIRLNAPVEFAQTASGWEVRRLVDGTVLHRGAGREGDADLDITVTPNDADHITYDALGRTMANADGTPAIAQLDFESAHPPGVSGYRPLRLQVLAGGLSRLCDPAVGSDDSRACL